jgi:hypothetical protein
MGTTSGASLSTAIVQAELQLPTLRDSQLPGYSTALVIVAAASTLVAVARWYGVVAIRRRGRG